MATFKVREGREGGRGGKGGEGGEGGKECGERWEWCICSL